ncbi:STAS domain-containing protein, partial [Ectothiorhodospiraceae bacterium WFHF3C12]|nr:STAS domain-containing protein [Ectothiorhodospiraceae bacterium WFHF3C12]
TGPLAVVALTTLLVVALGLDTQGVAVVGRIDAGLPALSLAFTGVEDPLGFLPDAALIALIGYVESVSVAKVLAHRRRQRVDPNQELIALGLSNVGASVAGGMPVAGGFSRSMVNYDAGARTQLAAVITAVLVALAALALTPLFTHLPKATLAAIIVVAVASLVNWREAVATWRYDRADFLALAVTFAGVLATGLEWGLVMGLALSIAIQLWRSGHPHVAVVGRVPGTEHFRNIRRHQVQTWPNLLLLRVDESLFFANAGLLEDVVSEALDDAPNARHLVLICSAVNRIDFSALETLESLSTGLAEAGVSLHLAEVKGPVMDRLKAGGFCEHFPGEIFLSTEHAVEELAEKQD